MEHYLQPIFDSDSESPAEYVRTIHGSKELRSDCLYDNDFGNYLLASEYYIEKYLQGFNGDLTPAEYYNIKGDLLMQLQDK